MNDNENKKTPEEPADEVLVDEALADEVLENVTGGKSVIIDNFIHEDKNLGGIV